MSTPAPPARASGATASVDGQLRAAVRRGDTGWLSTHLGPGDCPPAVARLLVRHEDARLRHLGWSLVAERIAGPRTEESERIAFGALVPPTLDEPAETALVLADVVQRLWRYVPDQRRPPWRTAGLPVRVRLAWLRAELVNQPRTIGHEPAGELLYQAVAGIAAVDAADPEALVRELIERGDPVLHAEALRLTREGLHAGLLAPNRARGHLSRLLAPMRARDDAGPPSVAADVAVATLRELAQPWAALDPLPHDRLRALLAVDADPTVTDAVLSAAARHGHGDLLRQVAADAGAPPRCRQRALAELGELAGRADLGELTTIAATDSLLLGGSAIAALRAMHRRGHQPGDAHAAAIVDLVLADHTIGAADAATIMFTCRHAAFGRLSAAGPDDPSWPRRLDLLVGLARQGADDLPVGDTVTRVLADTTRPRPFLAALRALRYTPAEPMVVDALLREPEAALDTLEAIGGPRTAAALIVGLGLAATGDGIATGQSVAVGDGAPAGGIAAHLRPVRHQALTLLWHLSDDPDRRRALLSRLDPHELPRRIAVDLGSADQRELALLAAGFEPDNPAAALVRLARNGDGGTVATIADLLLRIVADLAADRQPRGGTRTVGADRSGDRLGGEPAVPTEVVAAIHGLGRRLYDRGKIRPVCLLDAADADAAGHALVATIALDLLERRDLAAGEQAVLLALLGGVPYPGIRARVRRLIRHHHRHVRKHAIALLAADGTGTDAQALSATLVALTGAGDAQTVRQVLLALADVRARWAAPAIAACLDHPAMNVKKTAAAALVDAGTPAVVPRLLYWLGHQDNPGLRGALVEALRAILGPAFAATVLAAAEHAADGRARDLLLSGVSGAVSARAVSALAQQRSPVGSALLTLVASGQVALAAGTVEDLVAQLTAYGLARPAAAPVTDQPDRDVSSLTQAGWSLESARRVVDRYQWRPEDLPAEQAARLRPMLADWLRSADTLPANRSAILRFTLWICPAPWSSGEAEVFARSARTLLAGLAGATGADRDALVAVLETAVPSLPPALVLDAVTQIRALPPVAAGHRSLLALLRRCGAVLTRADVEQSLAAARLGADPWRAEARVLREAFAVTTSAASEPARAWRLALQAAVHSARSLAEFRASGDQTLSSRDRLDALTDVFPSAGPETREAVLAWMEDLQPLDGPPWTMGEQARRPTTKPRTPHDGDLDQPRSAALRDRLLALLDAPTAAQRTAACLALNTWPEPEIGQAMLHVYLRGGVDVPLAGNLVRALAAADMADLRSATVDLADLRGADAARERVARLAFHLDPPDLCRLIPLLLEWWESGGPATRAAAEHALRRVPGHADTIAWYLRDRLDAGAWGLLDLLVGRPLLRTPELAETCRRLRAAGRGELADKLTLVDGPLRDARADQVDSAALEALRARSQPIVEPGADPDADPGASRSGLLDLIRTGHPEQIRRALTRLAEADEDDRPAAGHAAIDPDPELEQLLAALLEHPEPRVRRHAHRIGRRVLDRPTYLRHTAVLLDDPDPDTVRSAVRTLCHAADPSVVPAIVGLLTHPDTGVRRAAAAGLVQIGSPAVPALRHAAGRARPDRRHHYTAILDQITGPAEVPGEPG